MSQDLLEDFKDGIATLTLHHPESRNALTRDMFHRLAEALPRLAVNPDVRAVVLTGSGKSFCPGGNVKSFASMAKGGAQGSAHQGQPTDFDTRVIDLRLRADIARVLYEMPKPTLAVMPGAAAGAGLSIALACDMRIVAEDAKLTTAFSKIGLSGDFGGSFFLTQMVGSARAKELYFTGRVLTAKEALDMGIVNRVVPFEQIQEAGWAFAKELAALPTVAIGYMKKNLNLAAHASLSELLDVESTHMIRGFYTEDHKAAAAAFVEKKQPSFSGR
jgi:2-(1,2-epoxy-1,2-dihydrophenyl)acetyl-CoA isomerase